MEAKKEEIIARLRQDIAAWEGFRPPEPGAGGGIGLGEIEAAFPNGIFPTGAIHEFLSSTPEETSSSGAFICGILMALLKQGGVCLWVSYTRRVYPPALKLFGVDPDRVIFVDVPRQKDVLWVTEEALKCEGVTAVVCETKELPLMASKRLQLAVEKSRVTGFVLRKGVKEANTTACVSRWKIRPVRSKLRPGMPGVGFPRWETDLVKVKNGKTGSWIVEWREHAFQYVSPARQTEEHRRYA